MVELRNITVVELRCSSKLNNLGWQAFEEFDDCDAAETMSALYSVTVDIITSSRGRRAVTELMNEYVHHITQDVVSKFPSLEHWVEQFIMLLDRSPLLVVDWIMDREHIGLWRSPGFYTNSLENTRTTNALRNQWLHQVLKYQERADGDEASRDELFVAVFRIVVMFVHEIAFMMVAWLGSLGIPNQPEQVFPNALIANLPWSSAGTRMEWLLFGGQIEFHSAMLGRRRVGCPWLCSEKAYRIDFLDLNVLFDTKEKDTECIALIVKSRGTGYKLLHSAEGDRPKIIGMGKKDGHIVSFRERVRQLKTNPFRSLIPTLGGKDWDRVYLSGLFQCS